MKLKELLDEVFEVFQPVKAKGDCSFISGELHLASQHLKLLKDRLLECEEFKDVTEFNIIDTPHLETSDKRTFATYTMKLPKDAKFSGRVFLYSIGLSPEVYDPKTCYDPVKDGACITPTIYDAESFVPMKKIILAHNPECNSDFESDYKKLLHDLLDKVLDNPLDYQAKGERSIMVRGIFECVHENGVEYKKEIGDINLDCETYTYCPVYFISYEVCDGGEMGIAAKHKFIPCKLKNEFLKRFGAKGLNVTAKEIDDFLKENQ